MRRRARIKKHRHSVPAIPQLALWQSLMQSFGSTYCNQAVIAASIGTGTDYPATVDESTVWYYDGCSVYQAIANYRQESSWYTCSGYCSGPYMDWVETWVTSNPPGTGTANSHIVGFQVFPHGILNEWFRTGSTRSRNNVWKLATCSAFSHATLVQYQQNQRECAYMLNAAVAYEYAGFGTHPNKSIIVQALKDIVRETLVNYASPYPYGGSGTYPQPFMDALIAQALIGYYGQSGDSTVLATIKTIADVMWRDWWWGSGFYYNTNSLQGLPHTGSNQTSGTEDFSLLVAPLYAWLWQMGYGDTYQTTHDTIFQTGIQGAAIGSKGKTYSQCYRWSMDGVKWRSSPPGSFTMYPYRYFNNGIVGG